MTSYPRFFVENSGYYLDNLGDIAMLVAAVRRIRACTPDAVITVRTLAPERLKSIVPDVHPWVAPFTQTVSGPPQRRDWTLRHQEKSNLRASAVELAKASMRIARDTIASADLAKVVRQSDFVIGTGGGYITDSFPRVGLGVARSLLIAQRHGVPTAMFGQGLGPLDPNSKLWAAFSQVAPAMRLLGLREGLSGPGLARQLGTPASAVRITGDDAIDLLVDRRQSAPPTGWGLNVRVADYAKVTSESLSGMRHAVQELTRRLGSAPIPVPVDQCSDPSAIHELMKGTDRSHSAGDSPATVGELIDDVCNCRIVVTGSYHAAVFALSMGRPVVGIVRSDYYRDKFLGLGGQFPGGVQTIALDGPDFCERLVEASVEQWESWPGIAVALKESAANQSERGRQAYAEFLGASKP